MHKTAAPWEELREKYEAGGYTYMQLAKEYGVSVQTVGRHARKENWVSGCRNERRRRAESRNCLLEMTRALMRGAKRAAEEAEKGEACTKELKELAEDKLLFEEEPPRLRQLEKYIREQPWSREYEIVASASTLLEITAKGANKGGMVRRLAQLLHIRRENVCCVGDHANDIPMLEFAGMSFAPANAIESVRRVPGVRVLPDCRENAIAAMIAVLDQHYQ